MLSKSLAELAFIVLTITQQDVDRAHDARERHTINGQTITRCQAEAAPISLALHRAGYLTNLASDENVLVGRTHDQDAAEVYEMTGYAQSIQTRICVHGERPTLRYPIRVVLVRGEGPVVE